MTVLLKDRYFLLSICTSIGFFVGLLTANLLNRSISSKKIARPGLQKVNELKSLNDDSTECDTDSDADEELEKEEPCKLVLIVRTDLGMTKGKVAAQCSHATLACYKASLKSSQYLATWEHHGQAKIVLKSVSEEEMLGLQSAARFAGFVAESIKDAGRTQVTAGSRTVLGIGPAPISAIDRITGHLTLY